ncbi:substrate-binding domain-containing protein [Lysinimonas soli]|uniref:Substrate-binding domain-containing protein n=1 Tax=Lysinimonas soli TaxID=1074233 RepID=A0ABW0NSL8_9MICO
MVLFDANIDSRQVCSVGLDGAAAGRLAARHLIERGRHRLMVAGGPIAQVRERIAGAQQAVAAAPGVTLSVEETADLTVEEGRELGRRILAGPPDRRPDAVFAANDLLAIGLIQELIRDGRLRVPDDIAIIGYDDIDFAASNIVPLTSIRQPRDEIARTALELLEEEADGVHSHEHGLRLVQPQLVERDSTR